MEQSRKTTVIKKCPICDNEEFVPYLSTKDYFLTKETFNLEQCNLCDFVFTNPIPATDQLASYYDSPDYLSHDVSKKNLVGSVYNLLRNINLKRKYKLISNYKNDGKILDIGQGTGEFLNYMKARGWNATGIEPNDSARQFAKNNYGLNVFPESEIDRLEKTSFDIITLWHVLEHVADLKVRMQQISSLLAANGLLIIAVPNLNSPDSKKYGEKWAALDVPRHLYHFTKDSMTLLLKNHGFVVEKMHPMKLDAYYVSLLSERYLGKKIPHLPALIAGFTSNRRARQDNNYSSMIFVVKRK